MRILHVIGNLDPQSGGPPEVAASLAAAQAARGADVAVASLPGPRDRLLLDDVPGFDRVRLAGLPPSSARLAGMAGLVAAGPALDAAVAGRDVVHLHNVWEGLLARAARACRRAGVPYVILANGMLDDWSLAQSRLRKRVAMATTHRAMLRGAAAFHCLNDYEAQTIARLGFGPPCRVVGNGVWLERIDRGRAAAAALPAPVATGVGDAPFVLFLSRLHHKKGLDYLLDAFDRVAARRPDVRLVVAGPDGGELARVRAYAATSPHGPRVVIPGPLYGPDKFATLARASCFCLPSRQEGFPIAVLEALGAGAPVVISEQCHVPDAAAAGAGIVVPLDATRIAEGIARVLASPDPRGEFGARGRALVEERFTWPRVAEQSMAMYSSLGVRG